MATPAEIDALIHNRLQEFTSATPRFRRGTDPFSAAAATVGTVSPGAGRALGRAFSPVINASERVDLTLGEYLHSLGIPFTQAEEHIIPRGTGNTFQGRRVLTHRLSTPLARAAGLASIVGAALWAKKKLLESPPQVQNEAPMRSSPLAGVTTVQPVKAASIEDQKIAQAARVLEQQNHLIEELHQAYIEQAKVAAALVQAVKLAADGLIDVCDVTETAQRLLKDGQVKLSTAEEFVSPVGTLAPASRPEGKRDILTETLASLGG